MKTANGLCIAILINISILLFGHSTYAQAPTDPVIRSATHDAIEAIDLEKFSDATRRLSQALEEIEKDGRIRLDSELAPLYLLRARAYFRMGDDTKAGSDYKVAAKMNPENALTLNEAAWCLATSQNDAVRDGSTAIELSTKAMALLKEDANITGIPQQYLLAHFLDTHAACLAERGEFKEAVRVQLEAIKMLRSVPVETLPALVLTIDPLLLAGHLEHRLKILMYDWALLVKESPARLELYRTKQRFRYSYVPLKEVLPAGDPNEKNSNTMLETKPSPEHLAKIESLFAELKVAASLKENENLSTMVLHDKTKVRAIFSGLTIAERVDLIRRFDLEASKERPIRGASLEQSLASLSGASNRDWDFINSIIGPEAADFRAQYEAIMTNIAIAGRKVFEDADFQKDVNKLIEVLESKDNMNLRFLVDYFAGLESVTLKDGLLKELYQVRSNFPRKR